MYLPLITLGDGTNRQFPIAFPYISKSHVFLTVNDVAVPFVWLSGGLIEAVTAPAAGTTVVGKRVTPTDAPLVSVPDGIVPLGRDFNLQALQTLYATQEASYSSSAIYDLVTQAIAETLNNAQDADAARILAETALANTLAAYDNFDDRYLGPKSSHPLTDNDGNSLIGGTLYFNDAGQGMQIWTGTVWTAAYVDGTGVLLKAGGTMTGPLVLSGDASNALHAVPKQQLDAGLATKSSVFHIHNYLDIAGLPDTLGGFGITDAYTITQTDAEITLKGSKVGAAPRTGTAETLDLSDAGKMVTLTNAGAIALTIPTDAVAAFPLDTRIDLCQMGAGQVTVGGAGVIILSSGSKKKLTGQYSGATLWKQATDTWVLLGDISA